MDCAGEVVFDKLARFPREIVRHKAEFVNAVPASGAQQARCFGDYHCLLTIALHRQHGLTINHARLCRRDASLFCTGDEAVSPEASKIPPDNLSGIFIAFDADVGMRSPGQGQPGGDAETGSEFDHVVVGLDA